MGYNPYRKENGEFATKEEAGAKAGSDYDSAVASGDAARAMEIGDFVVENFPKSEKAQEILTNRYRPLGGTKAGQSVKARLREAGVSYPDTWNEMGSSEKDMWEDNAIRNLEKQQARHRKPRPSDAKPTSDPARVERKGRKMTEQEALLRDSVRDLAERLVEVRADNGDVAFEDANPERAKRRLNEAIEFADKRGNTHLMKKLTGATVLPSGAFKLADGRRANADRFIDTKTAIEHVNEQREELSHSMNALVADVKPGSYKFSNEKVSVSVSVKEGAVDDAAFEKLPEDVRKKISSPKPQIDIDLVREHISAEKQAQVMTTTQVADKIIGKPHDIGQLGVSANTNFTGSNPTERFQSGVNNIGGLYTDAREAFGKTQKDLKKESEEMSDAMKSVSAKQNPNGSTFIPARSQRNGIIITGRQNISRKLAEQVFTPAELKKVTVVKSAPDAAKAKAVLSDKDYERIFNAKKMSIRVSEKA